MKMRVAAVASAVISPALDSVRTAPGCVLAKPYLICWRVQGEILAIICETDQPFAFDLAERICKCHVAKLEMMAERFTVRSNVHQLRVLAPIRKPGHQTIGKPVAALEQTFKGNIVRNRRVIEKKVDGLPATHMTTIRACRVDAIL